MSPDGLSGLVCFAMVARHHGVEVVPDRLIHQHALDGTGIGIDGLVRIINESGFQARAAQLGWTDLAAAGEALPVLARTRNGTWVVVLRVDCTAGQADHVVIVDPVHAPNQALMVTADSFVANWDGQVVLCKRRYALTDEDRPFGLLWFVPELLRQRRLFLEVGLAALVLHVLGLSSPIFFQLIIDKVLVNQSHATLQVLIVGVIGAVVFEAVFGLMRRYLLLLASSKVDVRVSRRTFGHLLALPIAFFEANSSGVVVKHMQQAEKLREFLTGRLFITLLDASALFVFLPLLFFYSPALSGIVLLFALLIGLVIVAVMGPFRERLGHLYVAEGKRQSLLVEAIHGMPTVKALTLEPRLKRQWEDCVAQSLSTHFSVGRISIGAQTAMGLLEKLMTIAIIGFGTHLVFDGSLSVGALIAFQMLAGRVSGPLGQIITLAHEYQETALSVRMLGQVMNAPPERGRGGGLRPQLAGAIRFEDVTFRYNADSEPALAGISFAIPQGKIVGIVGRSGSGKTTVTRLIQAMHTAQSGLIRVDNHDLRELDVDHLRASIGVVLQENFLFRGTIRENIANPRPSATMAEIAEVARLAGATEFIERFPKGFDTLIEENGANLSGGQRQRLAIARALITRPRLLIFDEATSALDPDTEVVIQTNLRQMAENRTVIIVTHRLNALVDADSIIVLDRGRVVGQGRHAELLADNPIYAQLWAQQTRSGA